MSKESENELRKRTNTKAKEENDKNKVKKVEKEEKPKDDTKLSENERKNASFTHKLCNYLFEQEDSSYIALFRILWGLTMGYEFYLLCQNDFAKLIHNYYLNPYGWTFKYCYFDWVELMPLDYMKLYCFSNLIAAILITLGLKYRLASIYFFFGISYVFLVESINYLNHIYLVCVISLVMIFLPCNCCYSLDAWKHPNIRRDSLPKIVLLFLQLFLIIVYAYAGVVKINEDWLRGEPLRHWVGKKTNTIYGTLLTRESTVYFLSYGGLIYDLIVGPLLMWRYTFWLGVISSLFFHISNKLIFNIGIFPYLMIASTTLFFSPYTFRRILFKLRRPFSKFEIPKTISFSETRIRKITRKEKLIIFVVILFLAFWVLFPLRHYTYPGDVVWNEQGHVFSWRMKLRDKNCMGAVYGYQPEIKMPFYVPVEKTLSRTQTSKIFSRPWLFVQYAHNLGDLYAVNDTRAEIYTYWYCQVNYRPRQLYADPTLDYASIPKWDFYPWISELDPLPEKYQSQYPWNWEWNFNWLKGKDEVTIEFVTEEREEIKQFNQNIVNNTVVDFANFIANKHFGGDLTGITIEPLLVKGTNGVARDFWRAYQQQYESRAPRPPPPEEKLSFFDEIKK